MTDTIIDAVLETAVAEAITPPTVAGPDAIKIGCRALCQHFGTPCGCRGNPAYCHAVKYLPQVMAIVLAFKAAGLLPRTTVAPASAKIDHG